MFGKEKQETLFTPSDKITVFLKALMSPEVYGEPDKEPRYKYCESCQKGSHYGYHRLFNRERNAWIEWNSNEFFLIFKQENYIGTFRWFVKTDGEKVRLRFENYEAFNKYEPSLLSDLSTLKLKETDGTEIDLSLGEIPGNAFRISRENVGKVNKYLRPLFQSPKAQEEALEILLNKFDSSLVEEISLG